MLKNFAQKLGSFFSDACCFIGEIWKLTLIFYFCGLVSLTFYSIHTGLVLSPFWMYSPIFPFAAMFFVSCLYGTWEKWREEHAKTYLNGLVVVVAVLAWPVLVWHSVGSNTPENFPIIFTTRFWPICCFAATVIAERIYRMNRRRVGPASA